MGTVDVLTKDRMLEIEANAIVGGFIDVNGNLLLERHDESSFIAGNVASTVVLGVTDSATLDFTFTGAGTPASPYALTGDAVSLKTREVTDWNSATVPGFYWSTDAANSPTNEVTDYVFGIVTRHDSGRIVQEVRRGASTNFQNKFVRYWNGSAWAAWEFSGGAGRGGTAERNALFGTPATDADRVALANRKIMWFNTDFGWEESYYAVTGLSGLTAPGLVSGTASGWYPTGVGPECILEPTTTGAANTGTYVDNWNGSMRRLGGAAWFTAASTYLQILVPGYYDLEVWSIQSGGSGQADYHARVLNSAGTVVDWMSNLSIAPLSTSYFSRFHGSYESQLIRAGQRFSLFTSAGALNVHQVTGGTTYPSTRGQMMARYIRPALVSD